MIGSDDRNEPGERKLVTVLFADLRSSLALISGRDPEQADEILTDLTNLMLDAVRRHSGTVARLMGDGIMALFGAPRATEHHAARACMAALDIQRAVAEGQATMTHHLEDRIGVRIGLNSGEVIVKHVSDRHFNGYEANGEVVHVAARMEQLAGANTILLTAETARLVSRHFDLRSLRLQDVKGLTAPIEVFELLGERSAAAPPPAGNAGPFINRRDEIDAILAIRREAEAGHASVLVVRGEAGLGKSRLVAEAILRTPGTSHIGYAQTRPFHPRGYQLAADLLASCLDLRITRPGTIDPSALRAGLQALDAEALTAPLSVVFGLAVPDPTWAQLTPRERRDRMQDAIWQLLIRLANRRPLILIAEDLHRADPESQEALALAAERLAGTPFLLVATARPEWSCQWPAAVSVHDMQLAPLSSQHVGSLVAARLSGDQIRRVAEAVTRRAGGNPLFAEVLLSGLSDEAALIELESGLDHPQDGLSRRLPPTIRDVLAERIDQLPSVDKHILQAAAVTGPRMTETLLAQVAAADQAALAESVQRLRLAGFLDQVADPDPILVFRHELMREAVYAGLLMRTRREMHGRVVDAIRAAVGNEIDALAEELAEHARQAARWADAAEYARLAAAKAWERGANVEAAYFLRSALSSVERWPEEEPRRVAMLDLHLALRDPLFRLGRIDEIALHLAQIEKLMDPTTDWRKRGLFHVQLSHVNTLRAEAEGALSECAKAMTLADAHGDPALRARAKFQIGVELFLRWDLVSAIDALEDALRYVSDNPADNAYGLQRGFDSAALSYIARARAELGLFDRAQEDCERLFAMTAPRGRAFDSYFTCIANGHFHETRGQLALARDWLERAETWCRTADMPLLAAAAMSHLGLLMARSGDLSGAGAKLRETHDRIVTLGLKYQLAHCLASQAEVHLRSGDLNAAEALAEQAIDAAISRKAAGDEAQAMLVLAECLALQRSRPERQAALRAGALAIAERLSLRPLAERCRKGTAVSV